MSKLVGGVIGLLSKNELEQGRPILSSIVVGVSGKPGEGFFNWARELGVLSEGEDEETFWREECEKVYEAWKISYRK